MHSPRIDPHELLHKAYSVPAPVEAHFVEKPIGFTPLQAEHLPAIHASMQLENVARNMGGQVMKLQDTVIQQEGTLARLKEDSYLDDLTGAFNKRAALEKLHDLQSRGVKPHVYYIDLNNFKKVNDWSGHANGDKVLVAITASLLENLRPGEELFRMGGDEFMIVKDPTAEPQDRRQRQEPPSAEIIDKRSGSDRRIEENDIEGVKKRILKVFELTLDSITEILKDDELVNTLGLSLGHAKLDDGQTIEDLIHTADFDMYVNKRAQKQAGARDFSLRAAD